MILKVLGSFAALLGLVTLIFAAMAYSELQNAAASEMVPPPDSMPLTKIVTPELVNPGSGGAKPATLARTAFNRIYIVGGVGIVLIVLGVTIVAAPQARGIKQNASDGSESQTSSQYAQQDSNLRPLD